MYNEKVSVIVPVYKTEKQLIAKCLDSIMHQTYNNLEIIIVDDGNGVELAGFIDEIKNKDERIKLVRHTVNKGLFLSRITGVKSSLGKYVLFVDSDDSIACDWVRLLVDKIEKTNADITMGRTICVDNAGWHYVYNRNDDLCQNSPWVKSQILDVLMEDAGLDFSLHTIWNKIYKRDLWEKALPFFETITKHFVMTEDILFSVVLFYYAEKLSFSNHDGYFYFRNEDSSTMEKQSNVKLKKNIEDIIYSFENIERFLREKKIYDKYIDEVVAVKERYFRWWSAIVSEFADNKDADLITKTFLDFFDKDKFEFAKEEDGYFTSQRTTWNNGLEEIKQEFLNDKYKIVSFDLFDTLVYRSVWEPTDVFGIVAEKLSDELYSQTYKSMREVAERTVRKEISMAKPQYEDVTLTEIYDCIKREYNVPSEIIEEMYKIENEIEISLSHTRNIGKELYDLALYLGKKIVITSDMYLEMKTIESILRKNGYNGFQKIYLSSDCRALKSSGKLFDCIARENPNVSYSEIIHIGDDFESDFSIPNKKNIKSIYIPKTKDVYVRYLKNADGSVDDKFWGKHSLIEINYWNNPSLKSIMAVQSNLIFDNPFVSYLEESDYNSTPYKIGAVPVGMHMFGLAYQLAKSAIEFNHSKVIFTSRDGFYLKKIYDCIRENILRSAPTSDYVYVSRKALIPFEICKKEDVYIIAENIEASAHSPNNVLDIYKSVLTPITLEIEKEYASRGFMRLDEKFDSKDELLAFLKIMGELQYNQELRDKNAENCAAFLKKNIGKGDLVFDLGYSAKLHSAIVKALGYNVHSYYVHTNGFEALKRIRKNNFKISNFYDFSPSMSGIVNEFIFSAYEGSCVGYKEKNGKIYPIIEKRRVAYLEKYVLDEMSRGAVAFVKKYINEYLQYIDSDLYLRPFDTAFLYENMLTSIKSVDKEVFSECRVEDEYFGGIRDIKLDEIWDWQIKFKNLDNCINTQFKDQNLEYELYLRTVSSKGKIFKALYWMIVNPKFFKQRIVERIGRRTR